MYQSILLTILALLAYKTDGIEASDKSIYFPLLMPDVQPLHPESYLCTAFKMPRYHHEFIVEYLPNATKETAHHILIYGCRIPGYYERDTPRAVWDCGEMNFHQHKHKTHHKRGDDENSDADDIWPRAPVCRNGHQQVVYSWAMDAPKLKLPDGVGFKVGYGSDIDYLVLQVHYANVDRFLRGETDHSGITLRMLPKDNNEINKLAGVLLMATNGRIKPKSQEFFDSACILDDDIPIHPFAFRTHTHKLGKVVSGYSVDGQNEWHLIGKGNPQLPQMFYQVQDKSLTIQPGDKLMARCYMYNFQNHTVYIGPTGNDEMCNFYIMYYVDNMERILNRKICSTIGPPGFYWQNIVRVPGHVQKYTTLFP